MSQNKSLTSQTLVVRFGNTTFVRVLVPPGFLWGALQSHDVVGWRGWSELLEGLFA